MLNLENHQEIKDFIINLQNMVFPYKETTFDILEKELEKNGLEISAFYDSYDDFTILAKESISIKILNKNNLLKVSPKFSICYTLVERPEKDGYMLHFSSIKYGIYCSVNSYHFLSNGRVMERDDGANVRFVRFFQVPKNKQELENVVNNNPRVEELVTGFFAMSSTFGSLMSSKDRFKLSDKFDNNNKSFFNFIYKNFNF